MAVLPQRHDLSSDDSQLTEAHQTDVRRRLDAYRDNPKAGSPWEEVRIRLVADTRPIGLPFRSELSTRLEDG